MPLLQNILLALWATGFGFGSGALVVRAGLSSVFTEPRGENFGGGLILLDNLAGICAPIQRAKAAC